MNIFSLTLLSIATAMIGVGISYSKIYLYHLVLFALLSVIAFRTIKAKKIVLHKPATRYHYFFLAITFWYLLSTLWSISPSSSIRYFIYISLGSITALTIIYSTPNYFRLNKVFKVLTIVALAEIIICLLESYTSFRWPISPFSKLSPFFGREYILSGPNTPLSLYQESIGTPTGFRSQQNNMALTLLLMTPFFLLHKKIIIKIAGTAIAGLLIYNTTSRGIFACFILLGLVYLFAYSNKKILALISTSALLTSIYLLHLKNFSILPQSLQTRLNQASNVINLYLSTEKTSNKSILKRRQLVSNGIKSFKKNPIIGVGAGNSNQIQLSQGTIDGITNMHNFWLEILVDHGLLLSIPFFLWYLLLIVQLYKISPKDDLSYWSRSFSLALIIFIPGVVIISSAIYFLPMWIMLGFSVATINISKKKALLIKPQKIMLLAPAGSPHTQKWAKSLYDAGLSISIFSLHPVPYDHYTSHSKIKIYSCATKVSGPNQKSLKKIFYLITLPYLLFLIIKERPNIIHSHYASSYGLLGALTFFRPFFTSTWGTDVFAFPYTIPFGKIILRFVFWRSIKIFATSHALKKQTQKFTRKNIDVVSFGVDTDKFKETETSSIFDPGDFVIGSFKILKKVYGIDFLIRTFARLCSELPNKKLKLLIAGEGPESYHLKDLVLKLNCADRIHFLGEIPHSKVCNYINMTDICALLSKRESFGVAALEAASCSKPVIATNVDGLPEVIKHNHTGLLIPQNDTNATVDAFKKIINNQDLRKEMGQNGRKFVKENFEWKTNISQMVNHYNIAN